jgi:spermidine synthase
LLNDPRVEVVVGDVGKLIGNARGPGRYDAILLDIDNGPTALVRRGNQHLYDEAGIQRLVTALGPGGRAAIWSAAPDRAFSDRLKKAGFTSVEAVATRLYPTAKRSACTIYVADREPAAAAPVAKEPVRMPAAKRGRR